MNRHNIDVSVFLQNYESLLTSERFSRRLLFVESARLLQWQVFSSGSLKRPLLLICDSLYKD